MNKDTISALATPTGGAISIIRLSGPDSISIVNTIFSRDISQAKGNTLHYGEILDDKGETVDDVVVSIYRAPHSYTGEDCVEISCHGSAYIVQQILMLLEANGSRQAEPGEYTRRAYLNGKMDLSQAEAVADLIAATNRAQHDMAMSQLRGHFSKELNLLREKLLKLNSLLELELDFSDHEDLEFADRTELKNLANEIDKKIIHLADSFRTGNAMKNGIPVAIVGKTNVGKSTLLNALLHEDRAIVSDIHGTTRDTIEDTTTINGVTFRFIDTAGLRHTDDTIEQIGIDRALTTIERATIVLWVIDSQPSDSEMNEMLSRTTNKHLIIVANKSDINSTLAPYKSQTESSKSIDKNQVKSSKSPDKKQTESSKSAGKKQVECDNSQNNCYNFPCINISAKTGSGVPSLEQAIFNALSLPEISSSDVVVTNARHHNALMRAHNALTVVITGLNTNLSADLLAEDLKSVLDDLSTISGQSRITPQETLNNIFSHFCIGK